MITAEPVVTPKPQPPARNVTDGRVARPKSWYAAVVRMNRERKVSQMLQALQVENFVATQTEIHDWSDRRKRIERVVIPMIVFVNLDERETGEIVRHSFVDYLMRNPGAAAPSAIPGEQIEKLRRMVGCADMPVNFEQAPLEQGESVKIVRGKLRGFVGELARTPDAHAKVIVRLGCLGCASIQIPLTHIERLPLTP